MKVNKIDISKKIIRSPVKINSLSKELKKKLKQDNPAVKTNTTAFKKIKISSKKSKSKSIKNNLFIPTSLSNKPIEVTKDGVVDKFIETIKPPIVSVSTNEDNNQDKVKKPVEGNIQDKVEKHVEDNKTAETTTKPAIHKNVKKLSKSKKVTRKKKTTKNKTISINLNNGKVEKEKDIIEIINKFEKMDIKEIKDFLKNKGIDTKNNTKSKLLPYLYLLTCVDNDIKN